VHRLLYTHASFSWIGVKATMLWTRSFRCFGCFLAHPKMGKNKACLENNSIWSPRLCVCVSRQLLFVVYIRTSIYVLDIRLTY
jgi:hypothetical protein